MEMRILLLLCEQGMLLRQNSFRVAFIPNDMPEHNVCIATLQSHLNNTELAINLFKNSKQSQRSKDVEKTSKRVKSSRGWKVRLQEVKSKKRKNKEETEKRMFFLSWLTARASRTGSVCLMMLTLSPVRIDWSTRKVVLRIARITTSAGTRSPTNTGRECKFAVIPDFFLNHTKLIQI